MNRVVRRRLEMALRVRDFSRANPSADAGYASVLAQLEAQVGRMEALAKQQQGGYSTTRASTLRRRQLRRRMHHELLRHLVTVAEVAAAQEPGLAEQYRQPSGNATNEAFRIAARKLLEQGQADREVLVKHGLADRLLEDLERAVQDFDASVIESNQGRLAHVGAGAELKAVSDAVMALVELLDGLNRYRFSGNAEMRAAWASARNVVSGPSAGEAKPGGVPTPGVTPAPGAEDESRPAA